MCVAKGMIVTAARSTVYSSIWIWVYRRPWVTGSMGMPTLAYSFSRYSASAQKCGGVHRKMIRNSSSASELTSPVIAVQPSTGGGGPGGAAPEERSGPAGRGDKGGAGRKKQN